MAGYLGKAGWLAGADKSAALLGEDQFAFAGLPQRVNLARVLDQHLALTAEELVAAYLPALRLTAGGARRRIGSPDTPHGYGQRLHQALLLSDRVFAWLLNAASASHAAGMSTSASE